VDAGQEAGLHVGHARAERPATLGPIRPLGDRARIEDGVHMTDQQQSRPIAVEPADDEVAEPGFVANRLVVRALDGRAEV
jgi:hypothetical protein